MTKILSNIESFVSKGLSKAYSCTAGTKFCTKALDCAANNPDKFATAMVVTSIVSKDLVGCGFYTYQSLHNKKIPEEKRKFVASLDMMNGAIMVFGQLLAGLVFEKTLNEFLFKKLIDKKLDADIIKIHAKKAFAEAEKAGKKFSMDEIKEALKKQFGSGSKKYTAMKTGFKLIIVFGLTTALTKRVIAPLLATPLAGWFKGKYMDKNASKIEDSSKMAPGDIYIPWANTSNNRASSLNKVASK